MNRQCQSQWDCEWEKYCAVHSLDEWHSAVKMRFPVWISPELVDIISKEFHREMTYIDIICPKNGFIREYESGEKNHHDGN